MIKWRGFEIILFGATTNVKRCHLISRSTICKSKEDEGLGFRNLRSVNISYMMKLGLDAMPKPNAFWVRIVY